MSIWRTFFIFFGGWRGYMRLCAPVPRPPPRPARKRPPVQLFAKQSFHEKITTLLCAICTLSNNSFVYYAYLPISRSICQPFRQLWRRDFRYFVPGGYVCGCLIRYLSAYNLDPLRGFRIAVIRF